MRPLILTVLLLLPAAASALDCTPFQSWTCSQQSYFNVLNGEPGEVVCGVDYTGWTLHVVEATVAQPGWIRFVGVSAVSSGAHVTTAIMLMDDCAAGTCLASTQDLDLAELDVCVDAGTHTFVVASHTTAPGAFMDISMACLTCAQAQAYGFPCPACEVVGNEGAVWGAVKSRFR